MPTFLPKLPIMRQLNQAPYYTYRYIEDVLPMNIPIKFRELHR